MCSFEVYSSVLGAAGRGQAALLVVSGNAVHFICLQSLQMSTFLDFQFYHLNMDIDVELPVSIYALNFVALSYHFIDQKFNLTPTVGYSNCSVNSLRLVPVDQRKFS